MPKKNSDYKIKLLVLYEILKQNTDENHKLTTKELIAMLAKKGISCDRKILYNDIATLNENGFEILSTRGQQMEYYVPEAAFDNYELRILVDAVQAAKFISKKKTEELENKIISLAGSHKKDFVKDNITCLNEIKSSNEKVFYIVNDITNAILEGKKIQFKYFDLDIAGNKQYRKDGAFYVENPIDLAIIEDKYYMVVYNESHDDVATYRVDRMDKVDVLHEKSIKKKVQEAKDLRNKAFSMFRGEDKFVVLKFDKTITNQVIDRLGCDFFCQEETEKTYTIRAKINVSDTFFAWCFTFGEKMTILEPSEVVNEYRAKLATTLNSLPRV